jgi:hypothetical protein
MNTELEIVAYSVAMALTSWFVLLLTIVGFIIYERVSLPTAVLVEDKIKDAHVTTTIELIDEKLTPDNKLDMDLDTIVSLTRLRNRQLRRQVST